MIRIGITGVPGSGKTTLARRAASVYRNRSESKQVELVSEYARRYISKHGNINFLWEQYRILEKQLEWENSVKADILISDSPVHLGFLYASELLTNSSKDIMIYNDIFKKLSKLNENKPHYDLIVHLNPELEPVEDGIRKKEYFDNTWRKENNLNIQFIFKTLFKPKEFKIISNLDLEYRTNILLEYLSRHLI